MDRGRDSRRGGGDCIVYNVKKVSGRYCDDEDPVLTLSVSSECSRCLERMSEFAVFVELVLVSLLVFCIEVLPGVDAGNGLSMP